MNAKSNAFGYTPLHIAAWGPVVRRFGQQAEDFGADPDASYKEIVDVLLAEGAAINARDNDGETALDKAVKGASDKTVDLLRKHSGKTSEELDGEDK